MKKKDTPVAGSEIVKSSSKLMIESKIKTIRGLQVLLTRDLAELYKVEPRAINQAVKRNQERFPEWYCFQLNEQEFCSWKSQIVISKADDKGLENAKDLKSQNVISSWGGSRVAPYAFTEQGVAMLSAVLKSETAVRVSIEIVDAFVAMRHYLTENRDLIGEKNLLLTQMSLLTSQNSRDIADLSQKLAENCNKTDVIQTELQKVLDKFLEPSAFKHILILNGRRLEADVAYTQIYGMAQKSIFVFDDFVGVKTLDLLRGVAQNVNVTIFSDQRNGCALTQTMIDDFKAARPDISFERRPAGGIFHDRYIVLDYKTEKEKIFHCEASSKDAGKRVTTIDDIEYPEVYHELIEGVLKLR